jgi:DNA (cytosine-5)-methyltransferase 1
MLRSLDVFSCIGCHALGFHRAGIETVSFCEIDEWRRGVLARYFPGIPAHDDIRTFQPGAADICFGGPPCQTTSVGAAIHGYRTGNSLWPYQLRAGLLAGCEWIVVEQPVGNKTWEGAVSGDMERAGYHVARVEFAARDVGAPYPRRRVYLMGCASLPRLAIAWAAVPSAIERVKGAADARADWDAGQLAALPVAARDAGEMDRGPASRERRRWIEALGDSNPPQMAEVIGLAIMEAA